MSMFLGEAPTMIILESPGLPASGSHHYRCMVCTNLFRISDISYQTVKDLRHAHRMYIVACYPCHVELVPRLPAAENIPASAKAGRSILGLR
jgi:hypothetical protein